MQMMINALRSVRTHSPCLISQPLPPRFGRKASVVGFSQATTTSSSSEPYRTHNNDMDKELENNPNGKFGSVLLFFFFFIWRVLKFEAIYIVV